MRILYLHGFASSAASTKAAFFATRLREHGLALETPDLNQPGFSTLTISRMVEQTLRAIDAGSGGPVVLIGSSMGAFVAVQVAVRMSQRAGEPVAPVAARSPATVSRLVLLAPALDFARRGDVQFGDRSLDEWQQTGHTNVFHYGFGRLLPVGYELYADACGYDCLNAPLSIPVLAFQGRHDTVVDPSVVERWARARPNVELHLVDDDHQLGGSLDAIWKKTRVFLGLAAES